MIYKFQYQNSETRQIIITTNNDLTLIEDQVITEGNFLIFSDVKPLEMQLQDLNNTANLILLKQEGIL